MLPAKSIRHAINDLLSAPQPTVLVAGVPEVISVKRFPPSGGWVNDEDLPAIFVFARSERFSAFTMKKSERILQLDVVLQSKGASDEALDHLDDMQAEVERRLMNSGNLDGLVHSIIPTGSSVVLERGVVVFAGRVLNFDIKASAPW